MRVKTIQYEDMVNYKKPSMFVGTISCSGKCCTEAGIPLEVCHNDPWRSAQVIDIKDNEICWRYVSNPITQALVLGGLEPFEQFDEVLGLVDTFRCGFGIEDDIVIYTGYNENELEKEVKKLSFYPNIYIKFGRFVPDRPHRFDEILGVELSSDNQYGKKVS